MTDTSPRRRAEQLNAAGLIPPLPEDRPVDRQAHMCHADCGYPLHQVLIEQGWTLHPTCEPPKPERRRRGRRG